MCVAAPGRKENTLWLDDQTEFPLLSASFICLAEQSGDVISVKQKMVHASVENKVSHSALIK